MKLCDHSSDLNQEVLEEHSLKRKNQFVESYQDDYNPNDNDNNQNNLPPSTSLQTDSSSSKNIPQAPLDVGRRSDHRASKYSLSR